MELSDELMGLWLSILAFDWLFVGGIVAALSRNLNHPTISGQLEDIQIYHYIR
jgi:hypothetical protein